MFGIFPLLHRRVSESGTRDFLLAARTEPNDETARSEAASAAVADQRRSNALTPFILTREPSSAADEDALTISAEVVSVRINDLRIADSPRLNGTDQNHVRRLAEITELLPPIIVHHPSMQIIDGIHRVAAARVNDAEEIQARYFYGGWTDGFVLAVRTNVMHGLPLTQDDRQAAAKRIIHSHPQLSDRSIACATGLAAKTVARIRRISDYPSPDTRIGQDGKLRPLNTADGRRAASLLMTARPNASLRKIAKEAGISVGTVRDVRTRLQSGRDPVPDKHAGARQPASPRPAAHNPHAHQAVEPVDVNRLMERLSHDPSLRYTESGRLMLRWLAKHLVALPQIGEIVERIPPHCGILVAKIARVYAYAWNTLANELENRSELNA